MMCNSSETEIVWQIEFKKFSLNLLVLTQYMKGKCSVKSGRTVAYKKLASFYAWKLEKQTAKGVVMTAP